MKKIAFLAALFVILMFNTSHAVIRTIHAEWNYTPPSSPALTGFKLYQYDQVSTSIVAVYTIYGENMTSYVISNVNTPDGWTRFTMTAMFADGTESPHSAPFDYYTAPDPNGGTIDASCVEPLTILTDANGTDVSFSQCATIDGYDFSYEVSIADLYGNVLASTTTGDEAVNNIVLAPGNYTITIGLIYAGTTRATYTKPFTVTSANLLKPRVAGILMGVADASQTLVVTPMPNVGEIGSVARYLIGVTKVSTTGVETFDGEYTVLANGTNYVQAINLAGMRGAKVSVRAVTPAGVAGAETIIGLQIGDLTGDGKTTSADTTAWSAQRTKTCAVWNYNTRNMVTTPLTAIEKADLDHTGLVGNMVNSKYIELTGAIQPHMVGIQSTTAIYTP